MRNGSGTTRRNRFLGAVSGLTPKELERFTHMGGPGELAFVAFGRVGGETAMIAEAIQAIAPQSQRFEIALSVTDAWQRKGLGTLLLSHMECRARLLGPPYLVAHVLRTNHPLKRPPPKAAFAIPR